MQHCEHTRETSGVVSYKLTSSTRSTFSAFYSGVVFQPPIRGEFSVDTLDDCVVSGSNIVWSYSR